MDFRESRKEISIQVLNQSVINTSLYVIVIIFSICLAQNVFNWNSEELIKKGDSECYW